jgi:hypothetical protein
VGVKPLAYLHSVIPCAEFHENGAAHRTAVGNKVPDCGSIAPKSLLKKPCLLVSSGLAIPK